MPENFPKLTSDTKPQIWETQRTPKKMMPKKTTTPRHIIFKPQKSKIKKKSRKKPEEKNIIPIKEKRIIYPIS